MLEKLDISVKKCNILLYTLYVVNINIFGFFNYKI